jgi:hypothetical protein
MKSKFLSQFDSDILRKTLIYLTIAILLIVASFFIGFNKKDSIAPFPFFFGEILFFYAVLRLWEKTAYYLMEVAISIIIFLLFCFVGIDFLVKTFTQGHNAEDFAWLFGSIWVAGFIAGIIGAIRFRGYH